MAAEWATVALVIAGACAALDARVRHAAARAAASVKGACLGLVARHRLPTARCRPFEEIASDARRLGRRFHQTPRGVSFVKFESTRWAYDKVLAECCDALEIAHLLRVLPPGPELDVERRRVEWLLHQAGFDLDDAA